MKKSPENDPIRLRHMLDAARTIQEFSTGKSRLDLEADRMFSLAVVRLLEILGEASAHVADETRTRYPAIEWRRISDMRNRVIHAYFDVEGDIVWDSIVTYIPPLIAELEAILPPLDDDTGKSE